MYRLVLCAALVACEVPYVPLDEPPPVPSDAPAADAQPLIAAPLPLARPPIVVTGMHGAPLRALAVSEDSAVAVSADQHGSLRFWPSLDGKHEPVVVMARAASALAIVHDGHDGHDTDGVAFAGIDDIGQVEIVRLGALGEPRARTTPTLARPVVEIRPLDHAFLARCDDGSIVRIDANGTRGGEVHPGAHEHVTTLAVRHGAALAIIDAGGKIHGRWIELAKMRWGKVTPDLDIIPTHVELSPGHGRIAAAAYDGEEVRVLDVKTGDVVYSPVVNNFADPQLRPIGFQTDDELAVTRGGGGISWSTRPYPALIDQPFATGAAAVGDAGAIAETEGGLVLQDAATSESEYLGYQLATPMRLRALHGGGWLVTDGRMIATIDRSLHTTHAFQLDEVSNIDNGVYDVRFIDDHHAIAVAYVSPGQDIYLFDLASGTGTAIATATGVVEYNDARGVLAFRTADTISFARYDAKTGAFGAQAAVHFAGTSSQMRFLEPSASDLAVVIDASYSYDAATTATITRVHAVHADGTLELGKVRRIELARNWWRTNGNPDTLAGPIPPATPHVHASPDGKLVAELADAHVVLRDASGHERWSSSALGASDLSWGDDGTLVATGSGMARFDLATGDIAALQCGWRFGRWTKPLVGLGGNAATMCEQSWTATE